MSNPWESRRPSAPRAPKPVSAEAAARPSRNEVRMYGLNAVQAIFARRPEAIRKVYLAESRLAELKPLLAWCAANKVGYRLVDEGDLQKLAQSQHHEGVVTDVVRREELTLTEWLDALPEGPHCAVWLDGVGNPHNLGAILRSCAHFGAGAVLMPKNDPLGVSGAAARVAEGGAEAVQVVRLPERSLDALTLLRRSGFAAYATTVESGGDVFAQAMPARVAWILGAEATGMDLTLASLCDATVSIPGSGRVESLNVASATAVFLSQWASRHAP